MPPVEARCIKCGGDEDLMDRAMAPGMTYCAPCRKALTGTQYWDTGTEPLKVIITETVQFSVTVDPSEPRWAFLAMSPRSEWVGHLDEIASETEGPVEQVCTSENASGAWREVTLDD